MAILRPQQFETRLAEIGRLYKGGKKKENSRGQMVYGEDLTYFRFEPSERTYDLPSPVDGNSLAQHLVEQFIELGDEPRSIPIRFLHSTVDQVFKCSNEVWATVSGKSRCVRRCNGEKQLLHLVDQGTKKALSRDPIDCSALEGANECPNKCKPQGRLFFMMPDLKYPGQIVLTTHSINDILEIQGNLRLYQDWDLSKVPFRLCRTKRKVRFEQKGELKEIEKYLCHIEIDPQFGQAILGAQPQQYLAELQGVEVLDEGSVQMLEPATIDIDPYEGNSTWAKFLDLTSRAKDSEQLKKSEDWIRKDSHWALVKGLPNIDEILTSELETAKATLDGYTTAKESSLKALKSDVSSAIV